MVDNETKHVTSTVCRHSTLDRLSTRRHPAIIVKYIIDDSVTLAILTEHTRNSQADRRSLSVQSCMSAELVQYEFLARGV